MKRHLISLLQSKRAEIGGNHQTRRTPNATDVPGTAGVEARDGYDWLHQIKQTQATRVAAR